MTLVQHLHVYAAIQGEGEPKPPAEAGGLESHVDAMAFPSRDLLAMNPGDQFLNGKGHLFVLTRRPYCVGAGKPGPHRVRLTAIHITAEVARFIARTGWESATPYFRPRIVHGHHVIAIEPTTERAST